MSRQMSLGHFLFWSLLMATTSVFGLDVDSLPVWNPSVLTRDNSFVQNVQEDSTDSDRTDSLETHGYKTVQITVGDGGTQVDQELRLSIKGKLTDSVYVDALLLDVGRKAGDQTTSTLREVDQIYFRVESPHLFLHLGDLTWLDDGMGLYSLERSSLGAMGGVRGNLGNVYTEVRGVAGTDEVQHFVRKMNGVSGQQEGYALDVSGSYVSIVPQSETVWMNGNRLRRGVDYQVNYAGGLLDFMGNRIPSFDDEIQVEYDAYEDSRIFNLYGAVGTFKHPNIRMDVSGFRLENDVDRLRRGVWTDEDYALLKADRGDEFVRDDTLEALLRPTRTDRFGTRAQIQLNQQFYADVEFAMNRKDTNTLAHEVKGPEGRAARWFLTTDSTESLKHFPLAMSIYGNRVEQGFGILESPGSDMDWNTFGLQDQWDLIYADSNSLDDDLLHDELALRFRLGSSWFSHTSWGYRRDQDEDWNSSRAVWGLTHRTPTAKSELSLIRVASHQQDELENGIDMERYQGILSAAFLQGFVRPSGSGDLRYTRIETATQGKLLEDEVLYGKSNGGIGLYFDNGLVRETIGGRIAKRRGDRYDERWNDSLKSVSWLQEANINHKYFTLNHVLQYERVKRDSSGDESSWVGNLDGRFGNEYTGLEGSISYKLGLTEEQVYTAIYKAVAPGTGDVRYDSLTASYIEGVDNGDFVYEGMGRNDSIGAVRGSEASLKLDIRWCPGMFLGIRHGILRDISLGGSYDGEGRDTTGKTLYLPPFTAGELRKETSGKIEVEGLVDWQHPAGVGLTYKPGYLLDKKLSFISYYETVYSHDFEAGYQINPDHFVGFDFRIEQEELSALQVWNWDVHDGTLKYRFEFLHGFFVQPQGRYRTGSGSDDLGFDFEANLWEGALRLGYSRKNKVNSYANFSVVQTESDGDVIPYQVMSGYNDGRTYRLEFSVSVDINDFISLGGLYILRFGDAEENIFQKLSMEAKAYF